MDIHKGGKKVNLNPTSLSYVIHKNQFQMEQSSFSIKSKTIHFLENNMREYIHELRRDKDLLSRTQKHYP